MAAVTPVIVISSSSARLPLVIITVVPLGVSVVDAACILSIAACPVVPCGFVLGKCCSLAIAVNPPTSSTRSKIRALIAAVVATNASELDQVAPLAIVSLESCLRNLASASVSV